MPERVNIDRRTLVFYYLCDGTYSKLKYLILTLSSATTDEDNFFCAIQEGVIKAAYYVVLAYVWFFIQEVSDSVPLL